MLCYRLSDSAHADVISVLAWTHERFGETARLRYESLIVAALRDVAMQADRPGSILRRRTRRGCSIMSSAAMNRDIAVSHTG